MSQLYRRCITCCYPSTKPDLHFDEHGECSACRNFKNRPTLDWDGRMDAFIRLLETQPAYDGYHCIVPSSGGKDSTYQVLRILELGFKPLVVTATTCHLTPIGRRNIDNLSKLATTIEYTPNREVRAKLNVLGMELVGDISWPEHAAIFSIPFRMAKQLHVPLIVYGESPQREYGSPIGAEQAMSMTRRWVGEFAGMLGQRPMDFVGMNGITEADMQDYILPDDMEGVQAVWLGQAEVWDSWRNAQVAAKHGFEYELPHQSCWWAFENVDNAQTSWHDHLMYRKYAYGRLCAQISVDVRNGRISRAEAMQIVEGRDGLWPGIYCGVTVDTMLEKLGRDRDWLRTQLDKHTNWALFSEVIGGRPILKEFDTVEAAE